VVSDSGLAPNSATPQGAQPPNFPDPDLLATGVQIKALHVTDLRNAINALRTRLGLSVYSWQTSAGSGDLIKADRILEYGIRKYSDWPPINTIGNFVKAWRGPWGERALTNSFPHQNARKLVWRPRWKAMR